MLWVVVLLFCFLRGNYGTGRCCCVVLLFGDVKRFTKSRVSPKIFVLEFILKFRSVECFFWNVPGIWDFFFSEFWCLLGSPPFCLWVCGLFCFFFSGEQGLGFARVSNMKNRLEVACYVMFGSFWAQKKHVGMGRIRGLRCEDWANFFLGGAYREHYSTLSLRPYK